MKRHVHFIGIAGNAMAPIAKMFKDMNWEVTGSDQKAVFPPITTYLEDNHLKLFKGYDANNLSKKPDLVIVGRSALLVNKNNPEVIKAKELGCKILSYPEVLRDFLVKKNSIVIAGTYGKTTTTALTSWILENAGLNPSFMIAGLPLNFKDGVRKTDSEYSVIEGDEPPAMEESDVSKFMFYKPKYVLLTATKWDHLEIFKTENDYLRAFQNFLELIPKDGLLVICKDGENNLKVAQSAKCQVVWYSSKIKDADFYLNSREPCETGTTFEVVGNEEKITLQTSLLGEHNIQNIIGAVTLTRNLKVGADIIEKSVRTFEGVKGRLEDLGSFSGVHLFRDFAQHPVRVRESLSALRIKYPKSKIFCVFDPHSSVLQHKESLNWYAGNFDLADEVIIAKVTFPKEIPSKDWVTGPLIVGAIRKTQPKIIYEPIEEKIFEYLSKRVKSDDLIIFMSSGGLRTTTLIEKTKTYLEEKI